MSKADKLFVNMCEKILREGFSTEGETVRARWEDGLPAYTIKTFGVVNPIFYRIPEIQYSDLALKFPDYLLSSVNEPIKGINSSF